MKEDWVKQKDRLNTQGLEMTWMYLYYIEHLDKSKIELKLDITQFQHYFQQFLQMLNIQIAFQDDSDLKLLFANGNSYYITTNSIIKKVIDYFNNKTNW